MYKVVKVTFSPRVSSTKSTATSVISPAKVSRYPAIEPSPGREKVAFVLQIGMGTWAPCNRLIGVQVPSMHRDTERSIRNSFCAVSLSTVNLVYTRKKMTKYESQF